MEKLGSLAHLSATPAYSTVKRTHSLFGVKNRLSLWATVDEMQFFSYIRGLADPNDIQAAKKTANRLVLRHLQSLTTKPLRPYANPDALVKIRGSRVSTASLAEAIRKAQAQVSFLLAKRQS